jgi:hypothetical protein
MTLCACLLGLKWLVSNLQDLGDSVTGWADIDYVGGPLPMLMQGSAEKKAETLVLVGHSGCSSRTSALLGWTANPRGCVRGPVRGRALVSLLVHSDQ